MKRIASVVAIAAILALVAGPARAAGWPTPAKLHLESVAYFGALSGVTDSFQLVDLEIIGPGGAVKATDRTVSDAATGAFQFDLGIGALGGILAPGDEIVITLGGNPAWTYGLVYPRLTIIGADMGTGVITGLIYPRQESVEVSMTGSRVVSAPGPAVAQEIAVTWSTPPGGVTPGPAGRFRVTPEMTGGSFTGPFRRNDDFVINSLSRLVPGNDNFTFAMMFTGSVPGLLGLLNSSLANFSGYYGRSYRAALLSPAGLVKGTATGSIFILSPFSFFDFYNPSGGRVAIRPRDTIRVRGPGGYSTRVPRLAAVIDTVGNNVAVRGRKNAFILVTFVLHDDLGNELSPQPAPVWVLTDGGGLAAAAPESPFALRRGDWIQLDYTDGAGNGWEAIRQALPDTE